MVTMHSLPLYHSSQEETSKRLYQDERTPTRDLVHDSSTLEETTPTTSRRTRELERPF
jgi:hypothetical protein